MIVVIVDPEFKNSPPSLGDVPKDFDCHDDASIYDSNEDMNESVTSRDDINHDAVNHYETSRDEAVENEKNNYYSNEDKQDDANQTDVTQNNESDNDSDDDDDTSDSGVSQVTTQEANSPSPSSPHLTERTLSIMDDDAASTLSSTPTLTDRKMMDDSASTLPSTTKLTDTEVSMLAIQSSATKEFACITLPVSFYKFRLRHFDSFIILGRRWRSGRRASVEISPTL